MMQQRGEDFPTWRTRKDPLLSFTLPNWSPISSHRIVVTPRVFSNPGMSLKAEEVENF
ncbi:MAG: hypothetical protein P4L88_02570 [Rhodoferax sp.]|nr:hypothetical protein [Rhodoferax sp.]